jgi:hypothetical protein
MAITVAELLVEIGVDAKAAEKAADGLTKKLQKTGKAGDDAAKGVTKTAKSMELLGKAAKNAGKFADGVGKVLKGVGAGLTGLGIATLKTGATFEKLEAQLKTATGSAEGAEQALAFVRDFAKNTPFQVEEITSAFIKLTNLGLTPSEEALTAYGDTASAMGKDLDQLIEAVADATTGEFERLKEFGIKAKSEGENVSFTFRGVTTTVGKNAEEIERFLINLGQANFAGAMAEQMGTLNGIISNLKDAIAAFFLEVAEMGPLEEFKLLVSDLRDAAGSGKGGLARTLADTLTTAIRGLRRLLQGDLNKTIETVAKTFQFLVENVDNLIALFAGAKMAQAFAAMASGFTTMGIAAAGALGPIGLIAGALIALIPIAIDAGNKLGDVISKKSALRTTTKRGGARSLTERFATEDLARKAAGEEQIIREAQRTIETEEAGGNNRVTKGLAMDRIIGARRRLGELESRSNKIRAEQKAFAAARSKEDAADAADFGGFDRDFAAIRSSLGLAEGEEATGRKARQLEKARFALAEGKSLAEATKAAGIGRRRGGGRKKAKAKAAPKSATTLSEFLKAGKDQLGPIAASTPSTKEIEPTVAVDITNNNYSFDIDQIIRSNAEPGEVAREAAEAIKKEFQVRLAAAGQQLQPNLVR